MPAVAMTDKNIPL